MLLAAVGGAPLGAGCVIDVQPPYRNTDPEVVITLPPDGSHFPEGSSILFAGLVDDFQDPPWELDVAWTTDADPTWVVESIADDEGAVEISTNSLPPGNWTITLRATDAQGASAAAYVGVTVEDAPETPTVAWVRPIAGETGVEDTPFTFRVQASDAQDAPEELLVVLSSDADGDFCIVDLDATGVGECDAALSVYGHTLSATVTDLDGFEGSDTVYFEVTDGRDVDGDEDGWTPEQGDCDDTDPSTNPGAVEEENGVDDDCDGTIDEETYAYDDDGDCVCESPTCVGSVNSECGELAGYDCDDDDDGVYPDAPEQCDGVDNDCDDDVDEGTLCADDDGDGYTELDRDCDDGDASVYPGSPELADGLDNDCDGTVDEGTVGYDDDGDCACEYGPCIGSVNAACGTLVDGDCDDTASAISPTATEVCNGTDDDCDGSVDEGTTSTWYPDGDGDGVGSTSGATTACAAPAGYVASTGDCDDGDPSVYAGADELCNGVDDDCDGSVDEASASDAATWYRDADSDGFGTPSSTTVACTMPTGYVADSSDCDDARSSVRPGADESCNGLDDDCDGAVDEASALDASTWYRDGDGDGYGTASTTTTSCSQPSGYVANASDCNDGSASINPAAREECDEVDNDCDGSTDEGVTTTWYRDVDDDGYGGTSATTQACSRPSGYRADSSDCNDGNASVYPGAPESCNGTDDDCDGSTDEGVMSTWYRDADGDGYGSTSSTTSCSAPSGYVANAADCNDGSSVSYPGAPSSCDGVDNDCSSSASDEDSCAPFTVTLWDDDPVSGCSDTGSGSGVSETSSNLACGNLTYPDRHAYMVVTPTASCVAGATLTLYAETACRSDAANWTIAPPCGSTTYYDLHASCGYADDDRASSISQSRP